MISSEKTHALPHALSVKTLHIGMHGTVVTSGSVDKPGATLVLAIGFQQSGSDYFKHNPPTPAEMEHAIMTVEDELFRIRTLIVRESILVTTDASIRAIALIAGVTDRRELTLSRDLVEQTFDRLAAIVQGRPMSQDTIPTDPQFSATLLILREFMHHLHFSSITVR